MVKVEGCEGGGSGTPSHMRAEDGLVPKVEAPDFEPSPPRSFLINEGSLPSSSSSQVRLNLISMGFSTSLIDKAIHKHGEEDFDLLIETMCAQSAAETSKSESLDSLADGCSLDEEENASSFEFSSSDMEEIEDKKPLDVNLDKKVLLLKMKFLAEDVDLAISRLGHNASLPELIDFIIATQIAGSSEKNADGTDHGKNVITTETLFKTMDKTLRLLEMGFSEEEISTAIENFGSEAPVDELADSIFASQIANGRIKEEKDVLPDRGAYSVTSEYESKCIVRTTEERAKRVFSDIDVWETKPSTSNAVSQEWTEVSKGKKAKWIPINEKTSLHAHLRHEAITERAERSFHRKASSFEMPEDLDVKGFFPVRPEKQFLDSKNGNNCPPGRPYFFFGNVTDCTHETWGKLSRFLYGTEPEHVNTQFFSAFMRKEGYLHNLPTNNRVHILPRPSMTIEEALPHTKRWWPSWDTRKQLGCITTDSAGAAHICERLERMLTTSRGILSNEQKTDILHQCKTLNLLWVGEHKLRPIEPDHVEYILGYPMEHTKIWGLGDTDRLKALKYSFQTDTVGYHLSSLKSLYPDGLKILSVFSGIGGALVALARLGVHLHCVVSVEASETNREIMKRWWQSSGQLGELRQIGGIEKLNGQKIESLINEFGGFDIVICGNPHNYNYGSTRGDGSEGVDFMLFVEFVRVFQRVKNVMARS